MDNLVGALRRAATAGAGSVTFHRHGSPADHRTTTALVEDADAAARCLVGAGVRPGDSVGILGPNGIDWGVWALATWFAGGTLVPLPFPVGRPRDEVALHARTLARAAGCRIVLAAPELVDALRLRQARPWDRPPAPPSALPGEPGSEAVAVVQFTSGSTSDPKGAELSHGAVLAAVTATAAARGTPGVASPVSWLPMFHDWGLFGGLVSPLLEGGDAHVLPVADFVADPVAWLRLATEVSGTTLPGPPSIWPSVLRALEADAAGVDLSAVRRCILAAEMIDPGLVERLQEHGPRYGLRTEALATSFGMAEAVFTVAAAPVGDPIRIDELDGRRLVGCGYPVPGMAVRIAVGTDPVPDRHVGSIDIAGPQLLTRYRGSREPVRDADGWFRTGDLGYLSDGQLFVTGREKDLVIVHGHNVAPQDLEWVAERAVGVRRGRVIAVPGEDEGEVVVIAEPARGTDPVGLIDEVRRTLLTGSGVHTREVVVIRRGSLPRTTSGKLRRRAARAALLAEELPVVARG